MLEGGLFIFKEKDDEIVRELKKKRKKFGCLHVSCYLCSVREKEKENRNQTNSTIIILNNSFMKRNYLLPLTLSFLITLIAGSAHAQSEIYPQHFDLEQVVLLDGPMRQALILNTRTLLKYDADRLMTPFVRESGLAKTTDTKSKYYNWVTLHPSFRNWGGPEWSLEGHVGGHYLSALALSYASLKNDEGQQALATAAKKKLDYCLDIMNDCQRAYDNNTQGMKGFLGGQPITQIWTSMYSGDIAPYKRWGGWVPFYCQHKVLAGLRDAWLYSGSEQARDLYKNMCDWSVEVVSKLSEADMQNVLGNEHGGMNETLADAYKLFGDKRYLNAAKKYSHADMLNGMQTLNTTFLNNRHANTQVPKYIGFERIAQVDATATTYKTAARNFWQDVVDNRTVCIGGNSVDEHFLNQNNGDRYVNILNGPETCNTNNMMKLTEDLFDDTHSARYTDFYENAMYNHILSTQDPETGGYVYFTTLRPQGYKIYSQVDKGMWCCVGTGMENHSKYGHFVYTHSDALSTLYVNLFTASKLIDDVYALTQTTRFPYEESSRLTIDKGGDYTIAIRHPFWAGDGYAIKINGETQTITVRKGTASYVKIKKAWKKGDVIDIALPMELRIEPCPQLSQYIALKYGPILLAAKTSAADLKNEYAGEGRMDHAPGSMANSMSIVSSPLLICERNTVLNRVKKSGDLTFNFDVTRSDTQTEWRNLTLEPFFSTHHSRYMIYWYQQTQAQFENSSLAAEEAKNLAFLARTIDFVGTGEQQSEVGHQAQYSSSSTYGSFNGEIYRDVKAGGFIQYVLQNPDKLADDLSVMCRFTTSDKDRVAAIYIDGTKIADYKIPASFATAVNGFFNYEFPIPNELLKNADGTVKSQLTFKIVASGSTPCPGLYYVRLLKEYSKQYATNYQFDANDWGKTGDGGRVAQSNIKVNAADNTITVKASGNNNVCLSFGTEKYTINTNDKYFIVSGTNLSKNDGSAYLWWFNGTNHGSSVKPTRIQNTREGDVVMYWDIMSSGLDDKCQGQSYSFSQGNTIFGLTSTSGTSVIKYIGFNSKMEIPTGISTLSASINSDHNIYSLAGSRLGNMQKGINIVGGEKVFVR